MSNVRFVVLGIVTAMVVLTLVFSPNNNNSIEEIKPYIQEIALRDGMGMMTSSELMRDFGISTGDMESFILYGSEVEGDAREVLVIKTSGRGEADSFRRKLNLRLKEQIKELPDDQTQSGELLRHASVISRGNFVLFAVSNDCEEIVRAFSQAVRR